MNFLLMSLLVSQNLFAITYVGAVRDNAQSIVQTADGGFAVLGNTMSFSPGKPFVFKLDSAGSLVWTRRFWRTNFDHAWSMILAADGGFLVVSSTQNDLLLLKLSSSGNLE